MASQYSRKSSKPSYQLISSTATLIIILLLGICNTLQVVGAEQQQVDDTKETCGWDELNHSLLIECDDTAACRVDANTEDQPIWPSSYNEVLHLSSSRSGQRFELAHLERHNRLISEQMQLFDINSTLAVKTKRPVDQERKIHGFGGTLDLVKLAKAIESNSLNSSYGRILNDLFGDSPSAINLNQLRLPISPDIIKQHNLTDLMFNLDQVIKSVGKSQIKFIFDVDKMTSTNELVDLMYTIVSSAQPVNYTMISVLAIHHKSIRDYDFSASIGLNVMIYASLALDEVPEFMDWLDTVPDKARNIYGLLVQSQESTPYDLLAELGARQKLRVVVVGRPRPRTKYHGDWHNAQETAIEILNCLRHGAGGFLQDVSIIDLREPAQSDCSLYCLTSESSGRRQATHFKSPIFYATGHFSKYLSSARRLHFELFTQPNMFSAHYAAFMTLDESHVVAVVLNSNEHILPFSWTIDDTLVANVNLEPKSFNTLIVKV